MKETENALKAVPFYDKRDNRLYPTPSLHTNSWNGKTYAQPSTIYAGMGSLKPLTSVRRLPLSTTPPCPATTWR